ncbi:MULTISPECIES: LysR family regulator CbbR [unclassified Haematobacter]|uniref:LysR family regulator CbbR n=1 Tax=unclassified Haematobacter TaxID=2640585 RepID=UPI0025C3AA4B|nr:MULTISPECIES: LysR family transcriptional regulator [unclassified Haematobacter]
MPRVDAVTLRQLRILAAVASNGSLTAAGERLGLTPSAVHAQIRNLEAALAVPLLRRADNGGGSEPTPEAALVLEAGRRIEVALTQCAAQITALKSGHAGRVTLGVVSTAKYFAPRLVARLRAICPDVEVVLRESNRSGVVADLERHAVDLAIMGRPPRHPEVSATMIGPHPHGIVVPPDHPLAGRQVTIEHLLNETMITREEGSGTRILMTRYLDTEAEGQVFDLVQMGSNETIKQAVMAGLGIAFLSLHTVMDELSHGRLALLHAPGLPILRRWFLVYPAHVPLTPAANRIRTEVLDLKGSFLPANDLSLASGGDRPAGKP